MLNHKNRIPGTWTLFNGNGFYVNGSVASMIIDYSLKYIEVPVLFKIKFNYNKFLPYCFAGFGIGYLDKDNASEISVPKEFPYILEQNISDYTKDDQNFAIIGIGTEYILGNIFKVFAEIRYSNSFTDIAKSSHVDFKPHNFNFLLGIKTNIF
jgi:hypothetical protein